MALVTTDDYALLVNRLLWYIDNNMSGIDRNGLWIYAGIEQADFKTIMDAYLTYNYDSDGQLQSTGYKVDREARPAASEVFPASHGSNETTYTNGGVPAHS